MACVPHTTFTKQSYHGPAVSILDLPPEIQCNIFIFAHRDNSKTRAPRFPVEVILSHVCSAWRRTALKLPTLWTAFKFDSRLRVPDPAQKLEEYLSRSGTQLLELYFSFSSYDNCQLRDFALVETAILHTRRWHRFTLHSHWLYPALDLINRFDKLYVPKLEYFALSGLLATTGVSSRNVPIIDQLILTGAPRLYSVRMDTGILFRLNSLLPLLNITTLAIQGAARYGDSCRFRSDIFRSLLMIPNLTHLSIDSRICFDFTSIFSTANIPPLKMPSLRTLRISQDDFLLDILLYFDAPLLETLVLHKVYLGRVDTSRDIDEINTLVQLETFALLDCRYNYECSAPNQNTLKRVDRILHKIANCATHIIISSQCNRAFIQEGSTLLDFNRYEWPRLQRITLDLAWSYSLMHNIRMLERSPHLINFRVVEAVLEQWARHPDALTTLKKVCILDTMKVGDSMIEEPWPGSGGLFQENEDLQNKFIWNETFHAKGPTKR
ncbi:hypothetical protein M413DRAFT_30319 [Hebeloma cylindrosporum]|uniref:Uncharacterized protein n=1 Tax=Hebeloma cylindrosporum TaxID=76867 RepID=A0A0C2XKA9_HEBCY|nr:hypothetical protein M413DRAFT_30319 [Hebeloma cylindrosporum h7]